MTFFCRYQLCGVVDSCSPIYGTKALEKIAGLISLASSPKLLRAL